MKNFIYSALAFAAVFSVACNKENEAIEAPAGTPISIRAAFDEDTKTTYADGKTFSWVEGDKIALEVTKDGKYDVITLTADATGRSVNFSGTVPEGYTVCDYAFYPKLGSKYDYYSSDLGIQENGTARLWGTITPDLANPMASIPLIGCKQADGSYRFKTATGILKITVENIPADAYFFQLDATSGTALNGNFSFGDDCTLYMSNVETPWAQKYVSFSPQAEGETRTFYLPIPVGAIPAGMVASITSTSRGNIVLATTQKDINVTRNKVLNLGTLTVPSEEWQYLGKGQFKDQYVWNTIGRTDYVEVDFYQSLSNSNLFRIANPYGATGQATGADEWFTLNTSNPNSVSHETHCTGITLTKSDTYSWTGFIFSNPYQGIYARVLNYQASGLPANVQLCPCYRDAADRAMNTTEDYNYEIGNDHTNFAVEIVFPGASPYAALSGNTDDVIGTYSVRTVDYWNNPGTSTLTLAASNNTSKGNIMITEFDGHAVDSGNSCDYIYGTYAGGKITFPDPTATAPFYIDGNGANHVFANYEGGDLVLNVTRAGVLQNAVWIIGNRWQTAENNGFDSFWTIYDAFRQ